MQPIIVYLSQFLTLVDGQLGDPVGEVAVLSPLALAALPVVLAQRSLQVGDLPLPRGQLGAVAVVEGAAARLRESRGRKVAARAHAHAHAPESGPELGAAVGVVAGDAPVAVDGAGLTDVPVRRRRGNQEKELMYRAGQKSGP